MHTRLGIKVAYKVPELADRWALSDDDDEVGLHVLGCRVDILGFLSGLNAVLVSCDGSGHSADCTESLRRFSDP